MVISAIRGKTAAKMKFFRGLSPRNNPNRSPERRSATELDLVLEVGEAELLDVGDALRAEGRVVLLAVNLLTRLTGEGFQVVRLGIGLLPR